MLMHEHVQLYCSDIQRNQYVVNQGGHPITLVSMVITLWEKSLYAFCGSAAETISLASLALGFESFCNSLDMTTMEEQFSTPSVSTITGLKLRFLAHSDGQGLDHHHKLANFSRDLLHFFTFLLTRTNVCSQSPRLYATLTSCACVSFVSKCKCIMAWLVSFSQNF